MKFIWIILMVLNSTSFYNMNHIKIKFLSLEITEPPCFFLIIDKSNLIEITEDEFIESCMWDDYYCVSFVSENMFDSLINILSKDKEYNEIHLKNKLGNTSVYKYNSNNNGTLDSSYISQRNLEKVTTFFQKKENSLYVDSLLISFFNRWKELE